MTLTSWRPFGGQSKASALLTALAAALSISGCGDGGSDCGGPFCFSPGPPQATTLQLSSGSGQTGAPGRQLSQPIVVLVTDDKDRPIPDVQIGFNVSDGGGSVSEPTVKSDVEGRAEVAWTLGPEAGTQRLQAAANSPNDTPLDGSPLTISAEAVRPPPARLVLQSAPSETVRNGVQFEQQPIVQVLDADDQPVSQIQVVVSIASGGGTLSGTSNLPSDPTGQVTYTDLAILGSTGPRTLRFSVTDPALEVASGPITVEAGGAAAMTGVAPLTYEATVNSPVSPAPSVIVKDAAGNPVPGVAVTFTADRDASVSPLNVMTNQAGVAQVTSWTLGTTANVQYSLTAAIAGSGVTPVVFSATAKAGAAGRLQIVTQPSASARSGAALTIQPVIQLTDRNGNPSPQADVRVTASVTTGAGTLQNARATTNGAGQATFSGLTITGTVGNYTISFSAPGLEGVASTAITLSAGAPAQLTLTTPPTAARSRQPLSPQPVVQVQDASGNAVAQAGVQISVAMAGDGTLGGTTTVSTDANGVASFTDLAITGVPGPRTLSFSTASPALPSVTVGVVLPSVATIEVTTGAPPSAVVGTTIANVPVWTLKDAAGQTVADIPVALSASPGSAVTPTTITSDGGGIVQLQSWVLPTVVGDQYVVIVVTGTDLTDTVHVQATPAAAVTLQKISGDSQTAPTGSATLSQLLVVRAIDQYGNGVGGLTVTWDICEGSGQPFIDTTIEDGYSSALQPAASAPGTYCVRASVSGLAPVDFTYFVPAAATSSSQLQTEERSVVRPKGPPPVAPRQSGVKRPSSR